MLTFTLIRRLICALALLITGVHGVAAEETATRVVSLGGDITEIICALGEGSRLAGRDSTSNFPREAKALPDVGYLRQLGAEGVLSLRPDLIIAGASAGPPEVLKQIASTGIRIVRLPEAHSAEGLIEKVRLIAEALGDGEGGTKLIAELKDDIAKAKATVSEMAGHPRVLFIINAGNGAPMAAGRDTAADALIALAGGENVFSSYAGYKPISLEAAAAASPEAIALMEQTLTSMGGVEAIANHAALRLTPAAKARRIFGRDGSYLLSFGPRLPQAIIDFAQLIRQKGTL
jgi:iron complex transport system substrate-binding protein